MSLVRTLACAAVLLFVPWQALAAQVTSFPTLQRSQAERLIGMKVENQDGIFLGKIKNIIVDFSSGEIPYALISSGGVLGFHSQTRIVPAVALSASTAKRGIASLYIAKTAWDKLPPFKKQELRSLATPQRRREIFAMAGIPLAKAQRGAQSRGLTPTGPPALTKQAGANGEASLRLASDIVGRDVVNLEHRPVGEVTDMLIDFSGRRPPFAIISADRLLHRNQSYALPLVALRPGEKERLVVSVATAAFEHALPFTEALWDKAESQPPGIYLYQEKEPDNTGVNARDGFLKSLTPIKQSGQKADLNLTRKLRKAIVDDDSLSFTAKNIKIVTVERQITLRGPVTAESERQTILRHARKVGGGAGIRDELEVTP